MRSAAAGSPARSRGSASSGRRPSGSASTAPSCRPQDAGRRRGRRTSRRSGRAAPGSTRRWPASRPARSRCSTSRPCPGSPVKLSTGVMVLYADDESFTFMTPRRPYAVGVDHLLGPPRRRRHGRPGAGARAHVGPVRRAGLRPRRRTGSTTGSGGRPSRTWPATSGSRRRSSTSRSCASTSDASGATPATSATARRCGPPDTP